MTDLSRRDFFKVSAGVGAGLVLGFALPPRVRPFETAAAQTAGEFIPNGFIRIAPDNTITLIAHRSEMGQGVQTAIPMILADELDADWSQIRIEQAPADRAYGDQVTGGSVSISGAYLTLRQAGAAARAMLVGAAAAAWGVDPAECRTELSQVIHDSSGRRLTYGELAEAAALLPVPGRRDLRMKDPSEFRIIGTRKGQVDNPAYVTGKAVYASDVRLPGMLHAAVARCPVFVGGKLASLDSSAAEAVPGVRAVIEISNGVAVVAESTWAAWMGRDALQITWDEGPNAALDDDSIRARLLEALGELEPAQPEGEIVRYVEALYELPYLAHTTMEPMTCVADVTAGRCEVWAPTQDRQSAARVARNASGAGEVIVHVPPIGCGSGRRLEVDYVQEAVEISRAVGAPVKLFWPREDDLQHDYYRPGSLHRMRAGLNADGLPVTWEHHIAAQGIHGGGVVDGAQGIAYNFRQQVRGHPVQLPIPVGYWRAVFNNNNAFANECFLDEIAAETGRDPLELRLALLAEDAPLRAVLEKAAAEAGWGSPLPDGRFRGLACHSTWGATHVAHVVEVSVSGGEFKVERVVSAVDCGLPINPDMIEAQIEGGFAFGLNNVLNGRVRFDEGRVTQRGFRNYRLLRHTQMPPVEVHILPRTDNPSGMGEMSGPPSEPAIVNALCAATGRRIRRVPIQAEDLA